MNQRVYRLTLLAMLITIAVVGRLAMQYIPSVQPVTAIIIISGYLLGPSAGIIIGVATVYLTNLSLGMGIWTIWQMIAWGSIGLFAGIIGRFQWKKEKKILIIFSFFAAYYYGLILNSSMFVYTDKFIPFLLSSLPFDTYHAIGNVIFVSILYPILKKALKRTNNKIQ